MMQFQRARRVQARLRMALNGSSGSGKTYSALLLAKGLGGRIAVIDTERRSASLYADLCDYDTLDLGPPYSPKRYMDAIRAAEDAGYSTIIVDSLSHAWMGEGGILSIHDVTAKAQRSGNSFAAWREVTPQHNALVDALLSCNAHLIATMRTKTAWEVVEDDRGKKTPKKIGLAPVQREGMEYEFTTVLDIDAEFHIATASKDRTRLFTDAPVVLSEQHGVELRRWLETGEDEVASMTALLRQSGGQLDSLQATFRDLWRTAPRNTRDRLNAEYQRLKADLVPPDGTVEPLPADDAPEETLADRAARRAAELRGAAP